MQANDNVDSFMSINFFMFIMNTTGDYLYAFLKEINNYVLYYNFFVDIIIYIILLCYMDTIHFEYVNSYDYIIYRTF